MDNDEKMASKPLQVKEKIAAGKMNKFFEENCLLQQAFVKDGSVTVEQYMNSAAKALGGSVKFVDAVRFEKGEGIEKKVDDFAAEVAAAAGLAKVIQDRTTYPAGSPGGIQLVKKSFGLFRQAASEMQNQNFAA